MYIASLTRYDRKADWILTAAATSALPPFSDLAAVATIAASDGGGGTGTTACSSGSSCTADATTCTSAEKQCDDDVDASWPCPW
jgi:hypothetical protein